MYELLSHFILPILIDKKDRSKSEEKAVLLIPSQFLYEQETAYKRILGILDYVSGMTDNYAIDLYRRIKGIEIRLPYAQIHWILELCRKVEHSSYSRCVNGLCTF